MYLYIYNFLSKPTILLNDKMTIFNGLQISASNIYSKRVIFSPYVEILKMIHNGIYHFTDLWQNYLHLYEM